MDDVSIAYIVGVACTPNTGPCDVDEWNEYPNGVRPDYVEAATLDRAVARRFYGSYEVRSFEERLNNDDNTRVKRQKTGEDPSKGKLGSVRNATDEEEEGEPLMETYRVTDWVYYRRLMNYVDIDIRIRALRMLAHKITL